jgi:hypothetical protein
VPGEERGFPFIEAVRFVRLYFSCGCGLVMHMLARIPLGTGLNMIKCRLNNRNPDLRLHHPHFPILCVHQSLPLLTFSTYPSKSIYLGYKQCHSLLL